MKSAVALLLAGLAAAVPIQKRGVSTVVVVETVYQTSTQWVDANEAAYTQPAGSSTKSTPSTYVAPTTTSTSSSVSAYATPTTSSTSTSVSVYSTPSSSTTSTAAPTTTTTPVVTPTPTPSPSTTSTSAYVPSSTSSSAAPSATSGGGYGGASYTGDITYYTPGMGSCGIVNTSSDDIVAISHVLMDSAGVANPNLNPYCNRNIIISYNGNEVPAVVTDTCPGCDEGSIDLTESLFYKVAPNGDGRVHNVSWRFTS